MFFSYCLQNVTLAPGDVILDCGANSGDLSLELLKREPKVRYIGIEPGPREFAALERNVD